MKPPFNDYPLIKEFNEIKHYFRNYETKVSQSRIHDFHRFARLLQQAGYDVAFDFVGSVNFGVAESGSDVDFVLYVRCEDQHQGECDHEKCHTLLQIRNLILHTLMQEYVKEPYKTQIVDCINLNHLEAELKYPSPNSSVLFRFAFYRSICRGVNLRVLRPFHKELIQNQSLLSSMKPELDNVFQVLTRSMPHQLSFEKYRQRLGSSGIQIPISLMHKIHDHLNYQERRNKTDR